MVHIEAHPPFYRQRYLDCIAVILLTMGDGGDIGHKAPRQPLDCLMV